MTIKIYPRYCTLISFLYDEYKHCYKFDVFIANKITGSSNTLKVWDNCLIFVGVYDLKSLPDTLELISQSQNVVSGFKTDISIRSIGREIPAAISEAHGFVSTKSFVLLQLTHWSLTKLLQTV